MPTALIILLIAVAVVYFFDSIVRRGIEVVGSQVLGAGVTVSSVSLSPLNDSGTIRGLRIENPEGFNSDYAIQIEEVSVNINASSVFGEVVEIESVRFVQPQINYETRITTDNIRVLLDNLSSDETTLDLESTASDESAPADELRGFTTTAARQIIIRELQILDPQLQLVTALGRAPIPLPDIELQDIGARDRSTTVAEALRIVLSAVSNSILNVNLPSLDDLRESVGDQLQQGVEQVENVVEDTVERVGNRLRDILN